MALLYKKGSLVKKQIERLFFANNLSTYYERNSVSFNKLCQHN